MAQGYPNIVYGVRTFAPIKTVENPEALVETLGLPDTIAIQSPDFEQGYEWEDIHPIIFIKDSASGAFDGEWHGSVAASVVKEDWDSQLLSAIEAAGIAVEKPPRWYAFVEML